MNREALAAEVNRRVAPADIAHELTRPIGDDEREDVLELVRWFTRRYSSAEARLAYVRRAHARWMRHRA